jgi:hypothetical protein
LRFNAIPSLFLKLTMRRLLAVLTVTLGTAVPCVAQDNSPSPSLNERRLSVIKPSAAPASQPAAAAAAADAPQSASAPRGGLFSRLPPPSGKPINQARQPGTHTPGIALPTSRSASQPAPTPGDSPR